MHQKAKIKDHTHTQLTLPELTSRNLSANVAHARRSMIYRLLFQAQNEHHTHTITHIYIITVHICIYIYIHIHMMLHDIICDYTVCGDYDESLNCMCNQQFYF